MSSDLSTSSLTDEPKWPESFYHHKVQSHPHAELEKGTVVKDLLPIFAKSKLQTNQWEDESPFLEWSSNQSAKFEIFETSAGQDLWAD